MGRFGEVSERFQCAQEGWLLHKQSGMALVDDRAHVVDIGHVVSRSDHVHGYGPAGGEGAQHSQRLGMHCSAHRDSVAAGGLDGQHHRLRSSGGSIVERGVGDIQAGERADHRLELEDGLEGALRGLRLVRRVRRVELRPPDGAADDGGDETPVHACPEEIVQRTERVVARRQSLHLGDEVLLGEWRRELKDRIAERIRDGGEEISHVGGADHLEHGPAIGVAIGQVGHLRKYEEPLVTDVAGSSGLRSAPKVRA